MGTITDWIPFLSGYPVWARMIVIVCLTTGGGVLLLVPRKPEEPNQTKSQPSSERTLNFGNQQNAGTINNFFLGAPPPPPSTTPLTESMAIELIAKFKNEADKRGEHIELLSQIMTKWSQLQQLTKAQEQFTGHTDQEVNLLIDEEIRKTLALLLGNVEARATHQGNALIIKTGPNAFRVLNPVVMRVTPIITFPKLPPGVRANITENSPVGFSVMFVPSTIPIERLPTAMANAEF